ncbi:MAG: glycosyltransferase [Phycisphaerae bacterium]
MSPTVSVIIPTFNRADLLCEALDSVAVQTYRDFETIVVDDGSTEDIATAAERHSARPRVIRQTQQGPAAARNRGVCESSGRLLAFLDSDDMWLPEKLSRFVSVFDGSSEHDVWYGPMRPVDVSRRPVPGRTKPCRGGRIISALFQSSFVHVPTVMCTRECFEQYGGFDESLPVCEDYDLWLRMSIDKSFGLIDEPLALRRLHSGRLSKSSMQRNLAVKLAVLERFHESPAARRHLDDARARRRLARVSLAAGRASLRSGRFGAAVTCLKKAIGYGAPRLRVWPLITAARALRGLERGGDAEWKPLPAARRQSQP